VPPTGPGEQNDRPLSAHGHTAAALLAAGLRGEPIAAVYASPYPRAVQTVAPLAAALGLEVTLVDDLRERLLSPCDLPDWEEHCRRSFADADYTLPGGESGREAGARIGAVLRSLATRHPGQTVAAASHGNLIALALQARDPAYGFDAWREMPMPAVHRLDVSAE
jgi:2,3-bisphosphoglycerate-dependent phosphoglycerate mutase